ncbi:hypothetical protein P9597_10995 [Aneurinibacillus migulanus]|uniref:hypothetical protein n=1 Tax=Aneurinibacillus migulanus TaxID=47500 RepID=UPI002E1CB568|nr:hypothetical protein [Aneurinibacillus migulanus]
MSYVEANDAMWNSLTDDFSESFFSVLSSLFSYPSPFLFMIPLFVLAFGLLIIKGISLFFDMVSKKTKSFKGF